MTIRRTMAAAALSMSTFFIAAPAGAQEIVEFRGFGYLQNFTAGCADTGWVGTPQFNVRYRPSGVGSNGPSSRLSFFDRFYAFSLRLQDGRFNRTWQQVDAGGTGSTTFQWENPASVRVTRHAPSSIGATTPQVRLVGQIRNFDGVVGCNVTFEATLLARR